MAAIIVTKPSATVEMTVDVPDVGELHYNVTWKLRKADELEELEKSQRNMVDVVVEHFEGLEGPTNLEGVQGEEMGTIDEPTLREILQHSYYRKAFVMSFFATQQGRAKFAVKN